MEPKLKVIRRLVGNLTKGQYILVTDPITSSRTIGYVASVGTKFVKVNCLSNFSSMQSCQITFRTTLPNFCREVLLVLNVGDWLIANTLSTKPLPKPTIVLSREL